MKRERVVDFERGPVGLESLRTEAATYRPDAVVVAAGAWSAALAPGESPPVRPVKGQILELRVRGAMDDPLHRIVRTPRCYLVARGDGADGVYRLLEAAWEVLPEVAELELVQAQAGLRPGTPDNAPLVGPGELEGLIWATGHWRNGVLLAPLTGEAVAGLLAGDPLGDQLEAVAPGRFAQAAEARA